MRPVGANFDGAIRNENLCPGGTEVNGTGLPTRWVGSPFHFTNLVPNGHEVIRVHYDQDDHGEKQGKETADPQIANRL